MPAPSPISTNEEIVEAISKPKLRALAQWAREEGPEALERNVVEADENTEARGAFELALRYGEAFEPPRAAAALWKSVSSEASGKQALLALDHLLHCQDLEQRESWAPLLDMMLKHVARSVPMEEQLQWWQQPLYENEYRPARVLALALQGYSREALKTMRALLQAGLSPNFAAPGGEYNLLFEAARSSSAMMALLLKHGANSQWKSHTWATAESRCFDTAFRLCRSFNLGHTHEATLALVQATKWAKENFELLLAQAPDHKTRQSYEAERALALEKLFRDAPSATKPLLQQMLMEGEVAAGRASARPRI